MADRCVLYRYNSVHGLERLTRVLNTFSTPHSCPPRAARHVLRQRCRTFAVTVFRQRAPDLIRLESGTTRSRVTSAWPLPSASKHLLHPALLSWRAHAARRVWRSRCECLTGTAPYRFACMATTCPLGIARNELYVLVQQASLFQGCCWAAPKRYGCLLSQFAPALLITFTAPVVSNVGGALFDVRSACCYPLPNFRLSPTASRVWRKSTS